MRHSEILKRYWISSVDNPDTVKQCILDAMAEIELETREEMFEFAEYCTINGCKSQNGFCILDNAENHYFTDIETLFEHWKLNK